MTSFVETTAISLRKGDTTANSNFTGILGELTADLGYTSSGGAQGTDINTTLRLHNGVTKGGIPMCRADMRNITTKVLAENRILIDDKNLAYADLSNIETSYDASVVSRIQNTLSSYGFISETELDDVLEDYAKANMSNVASSSLATGRGNNNLAYADTRNINTKDLVDDVKHDGTNNNKPLAYADASNLNTNNLITTRSSEYGPTLATASLNNVDSVTWDTLFNNYGLEKVSNKDPLIPDNSALITAGHYPDTNAVKNYVDSKISGTGFLTVDLKNISTYEPLYASDATALNIYSNDVACIIANGSGFTADEEFFTGIWLQNDLKHLTVICDELDANGYPTLAGIGLKEKEGNTNISGYIYIESGSNARARVTIASTLNSITNIYTYEVIAVSAVDPNVPGGFITYEEYVSDSALFAEPLKIIIGSVDTQGAITAFNYNILSGHTRFPNTQVTITSQTSISAIILATCVSDLPEIGGAGLLKLNLTNLPGMSDNDKSLAENVAWRINQNEPIPATTVSSIAAKNYDTLVTIGQVWDALKQNSISINYNAGINIPAGYTMSAPATGVIIVHGQDGQTVSGNFTVGSTIVAQFGTSLASTVNKVWGPFMITKNTTFTVTGFNSTFYPFA